MNILAQLPADLKEKVTIYRIDELTNRREIVAKNLECYINPGNNQIRLEDGIALKILDFKMHIGKPNFEIQEGDHVERFDADGEKLEVLRVFRIRPYGNRHMNIILRSQGVL